MFNWLFVSNNKTQAIHMETSTIKISDKTLDKFLKDNPGFDI
jgi:hypothetical protein